MDETHAELERLRVELALAKERIARLEAENAHLRISLGLAQSGQRKATTEVTR